MNRSRIWRNMLILWTGSFLFFNTPGAFSELFPQGGHTSSAISLERRQEARNATGALHQKLRAWGVSVEVQDLLKEYGSFGSSLLVPIPSAGASLSSRTLVLACSLADPEGKDLLTLLLYQIHQGNIRPGVSLLIAFLGEEEPLSLDQASATLFDPPPPYRGLQALLDRFEDPEAVSLIYLSFSPLSTQLTLQYGSSGALASSQLLAAVFHSLKKAGLLSTLPTPYTILYKLGLITGDPRMGLMAEAGIDGLLIELPIELPGRGGTASEFPTAEETHAPLPAQNGHSALETALGPVTTSRGLSFFKELLENPSWSYLQRDQHYSLFPTFQGTWYILPEKQTVHILLVLLFALFCFVGSYSIIYRQSLLVQWIVFIRRSWVLLLYYLVFAVLCWGSSFFISLWNFNSPYPPALLKILLATAVSLGLFSFFSGVHVPRRAEFYGHGAFFFLFVISLVAVSLDVSFFLPILWFFLWVFLASVWKHPVLNGLALIMAPLQFGRILYTTYTLQETTLAHHLLSPGLGENILLALFVFPLLLLLKRLILLSYPPKRYSLACRFPLELALPLAILAMTGILSFSPGMVSLPFLPYPGVPGAMHGLPNRSEPGLLPAGESTNREELAGVESDQARETQPARGIDGTGTIQYRSGPVSSTILQTRLTTITFFDEKTLSLSVTCTGTPTLISILLEARSPAGERLEIYSSPVPVTFMNTHTARFVLGPLPSNPLVLDITVPENLKGRFIIRALGEQTGEEKEVLF
ncbi:hypothetical protein [Treponema sp. J25]|uniref:hypothetical protein n=1 Tax=Treponema sp. J25 TaxID=2094121 RepID=UPI0010451220|nr:hypothetical protein [Treponema sp. J25]